LSLDDATIRPIPRAGRKVAPKGRLWRWLNWLPSWLISSRGADNPNRLEHILANVHVLQVDQNPVDIAELRDGVTAGRTVEDWQMPGGFRPGDLVIWHAGRQQYIAQGWAEAVPTLVREGPGPIAARLRAWNGSSRRWTAGR
jgi:hypothetical protein